MRTVKEEVSGGADDLVRDRDRVDHSRRALFDVPLVFDLSNGTHSELALQAGLQRGFRYHAALEWSGDVESLERLPELLDGDVVFDSWAKDGESVVLDLPSAVVHIELERYAGSTPTVTVQVQAGSRANARLAVTLVREALPEALAIPDRRVSVTFWYHGQHSARSVVRELDAPSWSDVQRNYPSQTRAALEILMRDLTAIVANGRLILWHGPPGTGKTTALRALAQENRTAMNLEYVLDPDGFFGRDAGYFVDVVFDEDAADDDRVRVIVLEDCDELLEADARNRGGQGLTRLLNLLDGLIGQGLKTAVVITTNEPLSSLHPAVMRPGRCGALVEFGLFDRPAAREWLQSAADGVALPERISLADLLALRDGRPITQARPRIGFRVPLSDE